MFRLLRFIKGYRKESILAPLFKLFEAILELFVPLCVAALIDKGIGGGDKAYIIKMTLLMIALGTVGLLFSFTAQWFSASTAIGFTKKMKSALFAHIQSLSAIDKDKLGDSTLLTRLTSDSNQVQSGINMFLRLFLRSPFVVIGAAIMAFVVDSTLAVIFAIVIPILGLIVYLIMRHTVPMYKTVQSKLDALTKKSRENLSGVRVLRAYCKEEDEKEEFREKTEDLKASQLGAGTYSSLLHPLTSVLINLAVIVLIYFGSLRYEMNLIALGSIIALVNYMNQILVELVKFANLIITLTRALASGNRIQSIFDIQPSIVSPKNVKNGSFEGEYAVEFDNASLTYREGGKPALSSVSLKVENGEKIGVIGATGSGKTTLINLIPRLYDTTEGSVSVFGSNVKSWDLHDLRDAIALVPQKPRLFKGTIRENLQWGNENASDEDLMDALEKAQALDFVMKKDGGLDSPVAQNGRNLSGGQRQRLTIARALVKKPHILILDDSAASLDYATESRLRAMIKDLDMTIFVVSQRTSSLVNMDRIVVLSDGCVDAVASHEELLESNELYQEIYNSQYGE